MHNRAPLIFRARQQRETREKLVTERKNETLLVFILTNTLKLKPM